MNAYQAAYANALAIMEVEQEKRDTYEVSFFKDRGLTRREAYVKDMEQAANRPKYRDRLINILMRLDTKCGDTVIKKQLSMFAKSA